MSLNPQNYGIPGLIRPGLPRELSNQTMTVHNDLKRVGMANPEILDGVFQHFYEGTGMLSEIMYYLDKSYNPLAKLKNQAKEKRQAGKSILDSQKVKELANYEFAWRVRAPQGFVYRVVEEPAFNVDGTVGRGGVPFSFVINKDLVDVDDVFMLNDGINQVKVLARQYDAPNRTRITVRLLIDEGGVNQAIPRFSLSLNSELSRVYNQKPEASTHGSKVLVRFGEWFRQSMTTMRFEWNMTGHAAHTKTGNKNNVTWLTWTGYDGKVGAYWIETWRYEMMREAAKAMDNMLFWGKRDIEATGRFRSDARGYQYITGDGAYHQSNNRFKREYTNLNDFSIIDDIMKSMYYTSNGVKPTFVVLPGIEFRLGFDKLIRNEFNQVPQVLYFDGQGNFNSADKRDTGINGIRSTFNYYETPVGKFIVSECNYFDRQEWARRYTNEGLNEQSFRAILINIEKDEFGMDPLTLVSMAGRKNVIGRIAGMSDPGPDGVLTTAQDIQGEHLLTSAGIALHNPNCIAELKRTRRRV